MTSNSHEPEQIDANEAVSLRLSEIENQSFPIPESEHVNHASENRLRKFGRALISLPSKTYQGLQRAAVAFQNDPVFAFRQTTEAAIITIEMNPISSGFIRYGGYAAILGATRNTPEAVAYLAGSTFVLEGAAMVSMADILNRGQNSIVRVVMKAVDKMVDPRRKVGMVAQMVLTNYLGVPALMFAKQREDPSRTFGKNVRHGAKATGLLTAAISIQGIAIAEGLTNITDPKYVGSGAVVVGGAAYFCGRLKKKAAENKEENNGSTSS